MIERKAAAYNELRTVFPVSPCCWAELLLIISLRTPVVAVPDISESGVVRLSLTARTPTPVISESPLRAVTQPSCKEPVQTPFFSQGYSMCPSPAKGWGRRRAERGSPNKSTSVLAIFLGCIYRCSTSCPAGYHSCFSLLTTKSFLHPYKCNVSDDTTPEAHHTQPSVQLSFQAELSLKIGRLGAFPQGLSALSFAPPQGNFWRGPQIHPPIGEVREVHLRRIMTLEMHVQYPPVTFVSLPPFVASNQIFDTYLSRYLIRSKIPGD